MKADDAQAPAQEWRVWSTLHCRVPVDAVAGGVVGAAQGGLHIADSWFAPKRLRSGFTDFHRWFRLGTNGYNDPAAWQGFLTRHPNVAQGIAALQEQAKSLRTDEKAPDDTERILALYDRVAEVAASITAGIEADRQARAREREAEEQAKADARRQEQLARRKEDDAYYDAPRAARRQQVTRACVVCGQPTTGTKKRRYCSAACRQRAYEQRTDAKHQQEQEDRDEV